MIRPQAGSRSWITGSTSSSSSSTPSRNGRELPYPPSLIYASCPPAIEPQSCQLRSVGVPVALPDDAQALERQQVVDVVDGLAVGDDRVRQAAGRDRRGLLPQLVAQPRDDAVHL